MSGSSAASGSVPLPPCWQRLVSLRHLPPLASGHPLSDHCPQSRSLWPRSPSISNDRRCQDQVLVPELPRGGSTGAHVHRSCLGDLCGQPPAGHPCSGVASEDDKHASWSQGHPACWLNHLLFLSASDSTLPGLSFPFSRASRLLPHTPTSSACDRGIRKLHAGSRTLAKPGPVQARAVGFLSTVSFRRVLFSVRTH